ncbi:MAG TPA: DUF177 domain-containing protein [Tepidiformaceae bacterium]|nr:DUF177 domain-containing protein [Tepidiformaceae bacterium]
MLFNVSQLLRSPAGEARHYVLEPERPVHAGTADLVRLPGGVLVTVSADVVLDAVCSRCLAPFGYPTHIDFDEIYVQEFDATTGVHLEPQEGEDDESFRIGANHLIDITEAVRQYSEMATAMQPLCSPDCPGLCPECGQDLSVGGCRCEREATDTRWSALSALKQTLHG